MPSVYLALSLKLDHTLCIISVTLLDTDLNYFWFELFLRTSVSTIIYSIFLLNLYPYIISHMLWYHTLYGLLLENFLFTTGERYKNTLTLYCKPKHLCMWQINLNLKSCVLLVFFHKYMCNLSYIFKIIIQKKLTGPFQLNCHLDVKCQNDNDLTYAV